MDSETLLDVAIAGYASTIEDVAAKVRGLKVRRNMLQSIWRLPDEVLRLIFAACLPDPVVDAFDKSTAKWIQITAVCSRWRTVALSDSRLWRRITGNLENEWVSTFLRRSGPGPLNVTLKLPHQREVVGDVLNSIARIRALAIQGYEWNVSPFITALTHEAPQLERFVIQVDRRRYGSGRSLKIPINTFSGQAPRLSELHVSRDVELPLAMPLYSHLRSFVDEAICVFAARQIIPRLTNIDHLRLHFECSHDNGDDGSQTLTTNLTVTKLFMEFLDPRSSIDLIHSLHLPSLTSLSLVFNLGSSALEVSQVEQIVAPIAAHVRTIVDNVGPLRELEIRQGDEGWISYRAFRDQVEAETDTVPLLLKFQWMRADDFARDRHFVISVETLRILDVEVLNFFDTALDQDTTSVQSEVLAATNPDFYDVSAGDKIPLPRLRKLVIANDTQMSLMHEVLLANVLLEFVRKRRAAGVSEIEEIHFVNYRGSLEYLTMSLESLVKVSWDGIAGG